MMNFTDFLLEGKMSDEQKEKFLENWDEERLEDWFGKGKHRVYLNLDKKIKKGDQTFSGIEMQVKDYLEENWPGRYIMDDYVKGYVLDTKNKNRVTRIGSLLQKDHELLNAFSQDAIRSGHKIIEKDPIVCISKHPLDIASMSTGRGWKSCKELPNEDNPKGGKHHAALDYEVNVLLIAYLIRQDDRDIEDPIARINMVPYYNKQGQTYYRVHTRTYGGQGELEKVFRRTIQGWLDKQQADIKKIRDTFTLDDKIYPDFINTRFISGVNKNQMLSKAKISGDYTINEKGEIDVDGDVKIFNKDVESILKDIGQFGRVTGNFDCSERKLTTLEGAPREVGGNFDVHSNFLINLKHLPKVIEGSFILSENRKLVSFEGGENTEVGEDVVADMITGVKTLKGFPKKVGGNVRIDCTRISRAYAIPLLGKKTKNNFENLEGLPEEIIGDLAIHTHGILSLKGSPRKIGGNFNITFNLVEYLEDGPEWVGEDYVAENVNLKSLKGVANYIGGNLNVKQNPELKLDHQPKTLLGDILHDVPDDMKTGLLNAFCSGEWMIRPDGKIDVNGSVEFDSEGTMMPDKYHNKAKGFKTYLSKLESLSEILEFHTVTGDFRLGAWLISLKDLEGSPVSVGRNVDLVGVNSITDLMGLPEKISGRLSIRSCAKLKSLVGCSDTINSLEIHDCDNIKTLEGCPVITGGNLSIYYLNKLETIEDIPAESKIFNFKLNLGVTKRPALINLVGFPENISGQIDIHGVKNWDGFPEKLLSKFFPYSDKPKQLLAESTYSKEIRDVQMLSKAKITGKYSINEKGEIDVEGDVEIIKKIQTNILQEIGQFGKVTGNFTCKKMPIETMLGCPIEVGGKLDFSECPKIKNLEGLSKIIRGDFWPPDIKSFAGGLETTIYGKTRFSVLDDIEEMPTIKGTLNLNHYRPTQFQLPEKFEGSLEFYTWYGLEGMPREIEGNFMVYQLKKNSNLEGGPEWVGGDYIVRNLELASLEGVAEHIGGDFDYRGNALSLNADEEDKHFPKYVGGKVLRSPRKGERI